jgi:hypothetical protein
MQKTYIINQKNKVRIVPASLNYPNPDLESKFLTYHGNQRVSTGKSQLPKHAEIDEIASYLAQIHSDILKVPSQLSHA